MFKDRRWAIAQVEYNPPTNGAAGLTSVRDILIVPRTPFDNENERLRNHFSESQLLHDDRDLLPEIRKNCQEEITISPSHLHPLAPAPRSCEKSSDWIENQNPTDVINSERYGAGSR